MMVRFLNVSLHYLGLIPWDRFVNEAVLSLKISVEAYLSSCSARGFREVAKMFIKLSQPLETRGYLEFFREQFAKPAYKGVIS